MTVSKEQNAYGHALTAVIQVFSVLAYPLHCTLYLNRIKMSSNGDGDKKVHSHSSVRTVKCSHVIS